MKRQQRLRAAADFQRVRSRGGRGWSHPLVMLYAAPNELGYSRVGVTVGKRVSKSAVARNRIRRRIREAVRLRYADLAPGHDLIVVARGQSLAANWDELRGAVEGVIGRAGLWAPRPTPGSPA